MPIAAAYHGAGGAGLYPHWEHFTEKMTCRTDRGTERQARRSSACYASDAMLASCFVPTLLWCSGLRSQSFLLLAQEKLHVEGQSDDKMESLLEPGAHCEDIEFNLSSVCAAFLNLAVMRAQIFTAVPDQIAWTLPEHSWHSGIHLRASFWTMHTPYHKL